VRIHPLPPKPGTSTSTISKTLIAPNAQEKAEVPRLKKQVVTPVPRDPQLEAFEAEKRKLSWLALRAAREEHWQLFSAAKGNPEKMMWMLERNKEIMKKWDEDSFAATGWIEGDTSVLYSEEKPKGVHPKEKKPSGQTVTREDSVPRLQDEQNDQKSAQQAMVTSEQEGLSTAMTNKEQEGQAQMQLPESLRPTPPSGIISGRNSMQVDDQESMG